MLRTGTGAGAKLSKRRLKRGVFCSIVDLEGAINRFLAEINDDTKPFTWTADPDKIIAAVKTQTPRVGSSSVNGSVLSSNVQRPGRCAGDLRAGNVAIAGGRAAPAVTEVQARTTDKTRPFERSLYHDRKPIFRGHHICG